MMKTLLLLVPALPLLSFVLLIVFGQRLPRALLACTGVAGIAASMLVTFVIACDCFATGDFKQALFLWSWLPLAAGAMADIAFHLDELSLAMISMVTLVSSLIALFSVKFMEGEEGLARYFAAMNLFVAMMLILVLADNLLLLYLGWEGVGLCSYLLIGFWYKNPETGRAAMKAFLTTRVGDVSLLLGIIIIAISFGTLQIESVSALAQQHWPANSAMPTIVALALLGGAVGKSAQLPLQTWLPDAMLGPTPVSALIHAATMVTAGVYLIARMNAIFALSNTAQLVVMIIGLATLLLASFSALFQRDLKRVLAYSTMSQIGYMFFALGVGAFSAAIFHLLVHAFFKALLFLGAGAIGYAMHHEYDMFKLGGLRRQLPLTFWTFLVGAACLAGLPLVTSGFYSKELILGSAFASQYGGFVPWALGLFGAFLTGLYTFRAVLITFFGEAKGHQELKPNWMMHVPLLVLAFLSIAVGFVEMPESLAHVTIFSTWMKGGLPTAPLQVVAHTTELYLLLIASVIPLLGLALAYFLYSKQKLQWKKETALLLFLRQGWGFDTLYEALFVRPYGAFARKLHADFMVGFFDFISGVMFIFHQYLANTQTGRVRTYATTMVCSLIMLIGIVVFK